MTRVLIVDDDRSVRHMLTQAFHDTEYEVATADSTQAALELIRERSPDVVLLDIELPDISGLEAFNKIRELDAKLPVIFITGGGTSDTAIEAMKLGAFDYLLKPLDFDTVREVTSQALEIRRLMHVPVGVSQSILPDDKGDQIVGRSPAMQEVFKAIGRVARQNVTVLIRGESGTGKELVARAIYQHSPRHDQPFLAVNCAAIPEHLLESELFGHEKGAFTGADRKRIGKFEQCSGGTIFLDEIGDMPPLLQSKMLRLLQQQQFQRVGGNETIETDVRIITATNRDLERMVADGVFREDLLYRLNGYTIVLPPLRQRGEDLVLLLEHFLARIGEDMGKKIDSISNDAIDQLRRYHWPGNVRELEHVVRHMLLQASGTVIAPNFLPSSVREAINVSPLRAERPMREENELPTDLAGFVGQRLESHSTDLYAETLEMMERYLISRVLTVADGNQSEASRILGITRGSLRHKIRALGITIEHVVTGDL
jgi:two-component system nitrogen regulation response regulator GlnG